jgi:peroxiredoxin
MTRFALASTLLSALAITACGQPTSSEASQKTTIETSESAANAAMERDRDAELQQINELGLKPYGPGSERTAETIDLLLPAPWDNVLDTSGNAITVQDIMGPQGAVIVFNRSADWCPYCQKQMIELEAAKGKLAEEGLTLTVLTYDSPDILKAFADEHDLTYTFASDTDSSTIKLWGLLNEGIPEGTRYSGVPHPGFAVLTPDGDIKGLVVNEDYKIRPSVDEIVKEAVAFRNAG